MFTRKQRLANECTHREYFAQFVTDGTRTAVLNSIGLSALKGSTDLHLNDIPLQRWDNTSFYIQSGSMEKAGDWLSPAGKVCILKEAARQILDAETGGEDYHADEIRGDQ